MLKFIIKIVTMFKLNLLSMILTTIIILILTTLTYSITQTEYETALCIAQPTACPDIKQRKGVCCKR